MRSFTALVSLFTLLVTPCIMAQEPISMEEARSHVEEYLSQFDTNGNGQVEITEVPEGPMRDDFQRADLNADGIVQVDEVIAAVQQAQEQMSDQMTVEEVFSNIDLDGNGLIEGEEIIDDDMAAWVTEVDADEDGAVSLEEMSTWADQMETEQLAAQREAIVEQIMQQFDANGDGALQVEGEIPPNGPATELAGADGNSDGEITAEELGIWLVEESERQAAESRAATIQAIIQQFDTNGDGVLQVADEIPAVGPPSELAEADFNGDGIVDAAEIEAFASGDAPQSAQSETAPATMPTTAPVTPEPASAS